MPKKNTAVKIAAESSKPAPETFASRMRYARVRVEDARGERESYLSDFRDAVAKVEPGAISHALQWKGENVLRADTFLKHTHLLPGFLADVAGVDEAALDRHLKDQSVVDAVGELSAKFVLAIACTDSEGVALGVAVVRLREERARLIRSLCGDGWGGMSDHGPWSHSSTSAVANLIAACDADAQRQTHALVSSILERIVDGVVEP